MTVAYVIHLSAATRHETASRPGIETQDEIDQSAFDRVEIRKGRGLGEISRKIRARISWWAALELASIPALGEIVNPAP
jgi:hypothetical protein